MPTNQSKPVGRTTSSLVLALFPDNMSLRHAVFDLYQAGFGAGQIRIGVSPEGKQAREPIYPSQRSRAKPVSPSNESKPLYSEVDLEEMLQELGELGVAGSGAGKERILRLDRETGGRGTLILVDAGRRSKEVQSILEWNRGWVRTEVAAQRFPPAA